MRVEQLIMKLYAICQHSLIQALHLNGRVLHTDTFSRMDVNYQDREQYPFITVHTTASASASTILP